MTGILIVAGLLALLVAFDLAATWWGVDSTDGVADFERW